MSNKLTIKANVHVAGVFFPGKTYVVDDHEYIRNLARYGNVEIVSESEAPLTLDLEEEAPSTETD